MCTQGRLHEVVLRVEMVVESLKGAKVPDTVTAENLQEFVEFQQLLQQTQETLLAIFMEMRDLGVDTGISYGIREIVLSQGGEFFDTLVAVRTVRQFVTYTNPEPRLGVHVATIITKINNILMPRIVEQLSDILQELKKQSAKGSWVRETIKAREEQ